MTEYKIDENGRRYIEVNPFGNTQRQQWITLVNMINYQTDGKCKDLCNELIRYINHAEDIFDELRIEDEN